MSSTMTLFAVAVIAFVLLSARASRAYVSAPMVFMVAGFAFGSTSFYDLAGTSIKTVAETTLALPVPRSRRAAAGGPAHRAGSTTAWPPRWVLFAIAAAAGTSRDAEDDLVPLAVLAVPLLCFYGADVVDRCLRWLTPRG